MVNGCWLRAASSDMLVPNVLVHHNHCLLAIGVYVLILMHCMTPKRWFITAGSLRIGY